MQGFKKPCGFLTHGGKTLQGDLFITSGGIFYHLEAQYNAGKF